MKKVIISLLIIFAVVVIYLFLSPVGPRLKYLFEQMESRSVIEYHLPVDRWKWEDVRMSSEKYTFENPEIDKTENNYRMYFHDNENIYIALSSDGLNWEIVEEPIFTQAGGATTVQLPDGRWRMYFGFLSEPGIIRSAVSKDGINFELEDGVRITLGKGDFADFEGLGHPQALEIDNGYRMYFDNGPPTGELKLTIVDGQCRLLYEENEDYITEIHSAYSKNGLNWVYEGVRIRAGHEPITNLVTAFSQFTIKVGAEYRMYFSPRLFKAKTGVPGNIADCRYEDHFDRLYLATSKDGLNWTIDKKLNVLGIDPTVTITDGKLRLYTWSGNKIYSYSQKIE